MVKSLIDKKIKIIFIAGGLNQPRIIKRIMSFYDAGFDVDVYGFDRKIYQNINYLPEIIKFHNLGYIENSKNYIKSFLYQKQKLIPIFSANNKENVIYYCFGFIPALLTKLYSKKQYLYEISDLIYGYFSNLFIIKFFKRIDKFIIKGSSLTIFTSEGFSKYLFGNTSNDPKILIQPNKMDPLFKKIKRDFDPVKNNSGISFGFVGGLRYPNTIFRFARIIGENFPEHRFLFYGDGVAQIYTEEALKIASTYKNVYFYGKFRNPEDLIEIYKHIDIIVACYDTKTLNEKIAEPNKLYESIFFNKPIIVSERTFVSKRVAQLKCGFSVDCSKNENIMKLIKSLSVNEINKIKNEIKTIDDLEIIDEPANIFNRIERMLPKLFVK